MKGTNTEIKCTRCHQRFQNNKLLRDHLQIEHKTLIPKISTLEWKTMQLFNCAKCTNNIFTTKAALSRHTNSHYERQDDRYNLERILDYIPPPMKARHAWKTNKNVKDKIQKDEVALSLVFNNVYSKVINA